MKKRKLHPWRDYNGPGKPITQKQMEAILERDFGIKPDAQGFYHRKDFDLFQDYLDGKLKTN